MTGSNASRSRTTSLSFMQPSTPISGWNANASVTVAAVASAPCGLCAASTMTVGLRPDDLQPARAT